MGAGRSCDLGFPLAKGLIGEIIRRLAFSRSVYETQSGDRVIYDALIKEAEEESSNLDVRQPSLFHHQSPNGQHRRGPVNTLIRRSIFEK